jgi:cytochrome c5
MYQLNTAQLALVTGGASTHDAFQPRNPMLANMEANPKPVLNFKPSGANSMASSIYDDTAWSCACHVNYVFSSPKNGDYNAQGQRYSWGIWWDDFN